MQKPGIKQVADACGLSVTTVSQALNGKGRVARATLARIRTCAQQLGYAPDAHAVLMARRRVAERRDTPLGLLLPRRKAGWATFSIADQAFVEVARRHGFQLSVHEVAGRAEAARLCRSLYNRGAAGVFFPAATEFADIPPEVLADLCVVVIGRSLQASPYCSVYHDIFESVRRACFEAVSRGYRRVCPFLVPHVPPVGDDRERWAAVQAVRAELGLDGPVLEPIMIPRGVDIRPTVRSVAPDAVISFNEYEYEMLREDGVRIPEDLGYVALHTSDPKITGFSFPLESLCEVAIETMTTLLQREERGIPHQARNTRLARIWNEGTSLPRR